MPGGQSRPLCSCIYRYYCFFNPAPGDLRILFPRVIRYAITKFMKTFILFLTVTVIFITLAPHARADAAYGNDTSERIRYIQQSLDAGTGSARLWWGGWTAFYSGATAVSLAAALTTNSKVLQVTGGVSAAESLIGLGGMLIFPFKARTAAEELRSMPENTPEERAQKLATAQSLLKKSSDAELAGKSWVQHFLGVLVNAAGAGVVWGVYGSRIKQAGGTPWQQALELFVIGTGVSELQIWTEPTRAISDEKNYVNTYHPRIDSKFFILPSENGLLFAAAVRF